MLKEYVFWTLFAAVLLGVVITLTGNYRRARAREIALEELHLKVLAEANAAKAANAGKLRESALAATPTTPATLPDASVSPRIGNPEPDPAVNARQADAVVSRPEAFDPAKTRLFVRGETAAGSFPGAMTGIPWLVSLGGRQKGLRFSIPALGLTIGRADDNDVIIIDGRVSAHHAWIGMVNGRPMLRDYQSLNGTFLNERLDVGVSEAALGNGDLIQFGGAGGDQYRFVVE